MWAIIGIVCGDLLLSWSSKQSYPPSSMADRHSMSSADSWSRGSRWRERRQKMGQDYRHEEQVERPVSWKGSSLMYRSASYILKQELYERRDKELERLCKQVRDLELQVWGKHQRRNHDDSPKDSGNTGESKGESFHQSSLRRSSDRSSKFVERQSDSSNWHGHYSAAIDAMSRALQRAARWPFSDEIKHAQMSRRFTRPPFISYDVRLTPLDTSAIIYRWFRFFNSCKWHP